LHFPAIVAFFAFSHSFTSSAALDVQQNILVNVLNGAGNLATISLTGKGQDGLATLVVLKQIKQ
jgi:hypothetical protein